MFWKTVLLACAAIFLWTSPGISGNAAAQTPQAQTAKSSAPAVRAKKKVVKKRAAKKRRAVRRVRRMAPSAAMLAGLPRTGDPLGLSSAAAVMFNPRTGEVAYQKNADSVLPVASLTKLMTALVTVESGLSLEQRITLRRADYVQSHAKSPLRSGMRMKRRELLIAALMSSDNRAAQALARTYPGGVRAFVRAMNDRAQLLGMTSTHFADPTGLSDRNKSTARDLAILVQAAHGHEALRRASTTKIAKLGAGPRGWVRMRSTNRLIFDSSWNLGLQKTGLTTAAGFCMALQASIEGEDWVMVLLDARSNVKRAGDMNALRRWQERRVASAGSAPPQS